MGWKKEGGKHWHFYVSEQVVIKLFIGGNRNVLFCKLFPKKMQTKQNDPKTFLINIRYIFSPFQNGSSCFFMVQSATTNQPLLSNFIKNIYLDFILFTTFLDIQKKRKGKGQRVKTIREGKRTYLCYFSGIRFHPLLPLDLSKATLNSFNAFIVHSEFIYVSTPLHNMELAF